MPKIRTVHRCQQCGAASPQWLGRCPECGEWGSLVEEVEAPTRSVTAHGLSPAPISIADVDPIGATRLATGVGELDRVLQGGLVAGSVTVLGGEPGIGKSTLLLQMLGNLAAGGTRCLLVSAEESAEQVRLRAERVGALADDLLLATATDVNDVIAHVETTKPAVIAVDSIQTISDPNVPGVAGSVSQVRECAQRLVLLARERAVATVLAGHVTKEGTLAGPRVLEHVVDTVLSFDGDRHHSLRLLHATKHRFGATGELGVFEMTSTGLIDVADASSLFLADRRTGAPGSVVAPTLEGARPVLVEIQALVAPTNAPMPRRSTQGLDNARVSMLLAVLERRAGLKFLGSDVYTSVAGGIRASEAGVDLAVALAIASANADVPIADATVVIGEVGLGGEVRQVPHLARRLSEASRLGFEQAIVPTSAPPCDGITLHRVDNVVRALETARLNP